MPIKKSAWKDLRKSQKRNQRNIAVKSELKTIAKKLEKLIAEKKKTEALDLYKILASKLDKAAGSKILHKNTAARKKSRVMKNLGRIA